MTCRVCGRFVSATAEGLCPDHGGSTALKLLLTSEYVGIPLTKGKKVDHINGDGLDNRRANVLPPGDTETTPRDDESPFQSPLMQEKDTGKLWPGDTETET